MNKWIVISLILVSMNAIAGVTKWVDSAGQVHYSDGPAPVNAKATTMNISSQPSAPVVVPQEKQDKKTEAVPSDATSTEPAKPVHDRTKDKVPYLTEAGQNGFKTYLDAPSPKGFLISPNGSFTICSGENCAEHASKACFEDHRDCKIYAIDNDVVYKK